MVMGMVRDFQTAWGMGMKFEINDNGNGNQLIGNEREWEY